MPKQPKRGKRPKQRKPAQSVAKAGAARSVTVAVSRDPKNPAECEIAPRVVYVEYGGTVRFKSGVGPLTIFFPTPGKPYVPFRPLKGRPFFAVGPRGARMHVLRSKARRPSRRVYVYAVYSRRLKTFAHASLPKMIIGP